MGLDTSDDAGVVQLDEHTALIQTLDFFTPIVDDPYLFGQIAATNALSDVYAMGGTPLTAMNIVGFPLDKLGVDVLAEILKGGADKVKEAGAILVGGHSIADQEPKYGLSVTGLAKPQEIWANSGAKDGDMLILTKPLGIGIITTAARKNINAEGVIKEREIVTNDLIEAANKYMTMLNKSACQAGREIEVNGCTDVTGFGLIGHAYEMAKASNVQITISSQHVPVIPGIEILLEKKCVPGGTYNNLTYLEDKVVFNDAITKQEKFILADPITSGGLLFAVSAEKGDALLRRLHELGVTEASIIGKVSQGGTPLVFVER